MEIRAPYVLVGVVTVVMTVALLAAFLWLAEASFDDPKRYDIFFDEPISGLDRDAAVRFNGIRVGRVVAARIDPEQPTRVHVTVAVEESAPIRQGAHAVVLPEGITGASYVQIESGSDAGAPLTAKPGQPRPVIPSRSSPLSKLVGSAPDLVSQGAILVERLSQAVNEENRRALSASLSRLEAITRDASAQTDALAAMVAEVRDAASSVDGAADRFGSWVTSDLAPLGTETRASLAEARQLVVRLDANLNDRLAPRWIRLTDDMQRVIDRAASIADQLEASPAEFLLQEDTVREVGLP